MLAQSKLIQMSPRHALIWLLPGGVASAAVGTMVYFDAPPLLILGLSVIGLVPTTVVYAWGLLKFRSYYEVKRSRADLLTMFHATAIQIIAMALCGVFLVAAFESYYAWSGSG